MTMRRSVIASVAATALVGSAAAAFPADAANVETAKATRAPVASFVVGDPGILHVGSTWYNFFTGHLGRVATSAHVNGPWKLDTAPALGQDPAWAQPTTAKKSPSYWAPSAVQVGSHYVLTFAAPRRDRPGQRCIGLGFATSPQGPYTPASTPLACIGGKYGAPDVMKGAVKADSVIDATPRLLTDSKGKSQLYVTYKTQHRVMTSKTKFHYYSTVRLVEVSKSSNASKIKLKHASQIITTRPTNIEENPVLVQRGKTFTLFTSLGGYTTCGYHTEYRTSTNLWSWPAASKRLSFPGATNTCGTGDADVQPTTSASTTIFWSGRRPTPTKKNKSKTSFFLYVGRLRWSGNTPRVTKVYPRG